MWVSGVAAKPAKKPKPFQFVAMWVVTCDVGCAGMDRFVLVVTLFKHELAEQSVRSEKSWIWPVALFWVGCEVCEKSGVQD